MSITFSISNKSVTTSEQNLLNSLRSDNVGQAVDNRTWLEQLGDMLHVTHNQKAIEDVCTLLDKSRTDDSYTFQRNVLNLLKHAKDPQELAKLVNGLTLKVEHKFGNSLVTISLPGADVVTMKFKGTNPFLCGLFEKNGEGVFKLCDNISTMSPDNLDELIDSLALPAKSGLNLIKSDVENFLAEQLKNPVSFNEAKTSQQVIRDLGRTCGYFPENTSVNSSVLTKENYRSIITADFGSILENALSVKANAIYHDQFCSLSPTQRSVINDILNQGEKDDGIDEKITAFLRKVNLLDPQGKSSLKDIIAFSVVLAWPQNKHDVLVQERLKDLDFNRQLLYLICVDQTYKNAILFKLKSMLPEVGLDLNNAKVNYCVNPKNSEEIEMKVEVPCVKSKMQYAQLSVAVKFSGSKKSDDIQMAARDMALKIELIDSDGRAIENSKNMHLATTEDEDYLATVRALLETIGRYH